MKIFAKLAADIPQVNYNELSTLTESLGGKGPYPLGGGYYMCGFPSEAAAIEVTERSCGSKEIGVLAGFCNRNKLEESSAQLSPLVGGKRFKIWMSPPDNDLVRIVAGSLDGYVDLTNPEVVVRIARTDDGWLVGSQRPKNARRLLSQLPPKNWPYFHPGALPAYFMGIMVNLTGILKGGLLSDPFCGTGSSLIAANLLGMVPVGADYSKKQVYGCLRNLRQLAPVGQFHLIRTDSMNLPIRDSAFDAAVFDPPYGKVSSLYGRSLDELLAHTFRSLAYALKTKGGVSFLYPSGIHIDAILQDTGFKLLLDYPMKVHRNLTRHLAVAKKVV